MYVPKQMNECFAHYGKAVSEIDGVRICNATYCESEERVLSTSRGEGDSEDSIPPCKQHGGLKVSRKERERFKYL